MNCKPLDFVATLRPYCAMKAQATFTVREYKNTFCERAAEVESGQTHYITKHGRPCLKISPAEGRENVADAIARIRAARVKGRVSLKASIAEGRL